MLFNLFLSDIEGPVIVNCPSDQTGDTDDRSPTGTVTWTPPTTTDNSGIVSLTSSHLPGDSFGIGSTAVIYTSTDSSFNTVICTFNVDITGNLYKKNRMVNSMIYHSNIIQLTLRILCIAIENTI